MIDHQDVVVEVDESRQHFTGTVVHDVASFDGKYVAAALKLSLT